MTAVSCAQYFFFKMPLKPKPRSYCDKRKCNTRSTEKTVTTKPPKKILISKKWHQNCSHEVKTKSDGTIDAKERADPNKVSTSLPAVPNNSELLDFCKTCGDTDDIETAVAQVSDTATNITSKNSVKSSKGNTKEKKLQNDTKQEEIKTKIVEEYYKNEKFAKSNSTIDHCKTHGKSTKKSVKIKTKKGKITLKTDKEEVKSEEVVEEYFLNEKFADLYDSTHEIDAILRNSQSLDTIEEDTEIQTSNSKRYIDSNVCILENSEDDTIFKRLKEFRDKNYFECHSARTRIKSKGSVTSLKDHTCSYRLYLNDRLFPVSIDDDYTGHIRCVDCNLPLELASKEDKPNGTIQAKVKLGSKTQDMVLLLPIKEPLIIKQRSKEKNDKDVVYFGVVKLDQYGNSKFNRTLPSDSLALRFQKGYRKFSDNPSYTYDKVEESDVIVI